MAFILIAEDNLELAESLAELLGFHHYDCAIAADGQTAWQLLQERDFDLILLDQTLPGMTGDAVVDCIKQQPELDGVRIIVMSGHPDPMPRHNDRVAYFLRKPFEIDLALRRIGEVVRYRR